jgi:hypothetical protein
MPREHASTTVLFIGELAPKSGGFAIGIAKALPEESQARPPIGRKQVRDSEKDFRQEMRISLKPCERARPWLSDNGRISSWRTIPSRPCALRKHTKRTSGVSNTLRLRLVRADWWTSLRIRSTSIFANVFDSESASRPSSVTSNEEQSRPPQYIRSSEFSDVCSTWRSARSS